MDYTMVNANCSRLEDGSIEVVALQIPDFRMVERASSDLERDASFQIARAYEERWGIHRIYVLFNSPDGSVTPAMLGGQRNM